MDTVGRIRSYIKRGVSSVSGPFHPFGGAVDIIVVEQPDGSFKSSPWYVRFGKFQGVLKAKEKIVNVSVNGVEADFYMYLDQTGEAYFLREAGNGGEELEPYTSSSSSGDEAHQMVDQRLSKSNSFNIESKGSDLTELGRTKIVARTKSHKSRILGLIFGQRSMKADSFDGEDGDPMMDRVDSLERAVIVADLLEMRWCTNIPAKHYRKDGGSRFGVPLDSESKVNEVVMSIDDKDPSPKSLGALSQPSSGDEQFQFTNFDGYRESKAVIVMTDSPGQSDVSDEESSAEAEKPNEKRENVSGAINIITVQMADGKGGMRLAESLPNLRREYLCFEYCGPDRPLARSLDSDFKYLGLSMCGKDYTSRVKSDGNMEEKLDADQVGTYDDLGLADTKIGSINPSAGGSWSWPFSFKRSQSRKVMNDGRHFVAENVMNLLKTNAKKMVRVMTPASDQLASLNLKEGCNTITFTFCTAMLGKQQVDAQIYLWKWNTRVIISDVDGTITKSDVLGQFMPLVGMDWSQTGVAHLFSAIKENGYQLLFLSARAISQAYHTRQFLFKLKQDGKSLPDGPVVISPDGLFPSLYREVIRRAPHEFKIATLQDIRDLFPVEHNPFYAGFGNRNTDEISYLKIGIPKGKIFTINPKGEIAVNKHINTKSYATLHALVNGMFPPITSFEQEDFNSWNYWKLPPPDI